MESAKPYLTTYTFNDDASAAITSGSTYWFKVEPIKWIVLNPTSYATDGYIYVVADEAVTANIPFYITSSSGSANWETSSIRTWLNEYFVSDAFTSEQQANLNTTTVTNGSTEDYYTYSTTDTAWLLSYEEVVTTYEGILFASSSKASTDDQRRRCAPTDFALANFCSGSTNSSYLTLEGYEVCTWWLRSAHASSSVLSVYYYGSIKSGYSPTYLINGVRPALQVNDTSIEMTYDSTTGRYYIEYGSYPQTYVDSWLEDVSYPGQGSGTSSDPYIVTSAEELAYFAYYTESGTGAISSSTYIELGADIDLSGKYWTRIGKSYTYHFVGNFNGNGHTITGLTIDANTNYQGLFGYCDTGVNIYNLNIDSASITNISGYTGILVGVANKSTTISNILITNSSVNSSSDYVGGIVGRSGWCTVVNVVVYADISGASYTGGLCGFYGGDLGSLAITSCMFNGSVTASGSYCGGLVGYVYYTAITIKNSISECNLSCTGDYCGGLFGLVNQHSYMVVASCYYSGHITYGGSTEYCGGLYGYQGSSSSSYKLTLTDCFAVCSITSTKLDSSSSLGITTSTSSYVTYNNCYVVENITWTDTSENHLYIVDNTGTTPTFDGFYYSDLVNGGYPFINYYGFSTGQDVYSYLIGLGFVVV